jgi:hypothetical protein
MRQTTDNADAAPQASMPESIVNARTYPIYEGVAVGLERILPQARQRARAIIEERPAESPAAEPEGAAEN